MKLSYTPASSDAWLLAVAGGSAVMVHSAIDADLGEQLMLALESGSGIQGILDILTRDGIARTPAFALVLREQPDQAAVRIVVRGSVQAQLWSSEGKDQVFRGEGVSTWSEAVVADAVAFAITTGAAAEGTLLPLRSGVVPALAVEAGARPAAPEEPMPEAAKRTKKSSTDAAKAAAAADAAPAAESDPEVTRAFEGTLAAPPPVLPPPPLPAAPEEDESYDFLFGQTVVRDISDAAVRVEEAEPATSATPEPQTGSLGDHDGNTVLTSNVRELRRLARERNAPEDAAVASAADHGPQYVLVLPSAERVPLTQTIIIGRSPSATKTSGDAIPRLIQLTTPEQDISRNHVQLTIEGGSIVITDLNSRNGTLLTLPGRPAQKLRAGEPMVAIGGSVIDLGGGVVLRVEEVS